MKLISLPFDLNEKHSEDEVVDMSQLKFPVDEDKQVRAALIFLRNTNVPLPISFNSCTFEQKEEYLMRFMFDDINVCVPDILGTWIKILLSDRLSQAELADVVSILTWKEILEFTKRHQDDINKVYQLAMSIPLYIIYAYSKFCKQRESEVNIDTDDLESTDYKGINFNNFANIIDCDWAFILISKPKEGIDPIMYTEYFSKKYAWVLRKCIHTLPYWNMIQIITGPTNLKDEFLKMLDDAIDIDKENTEG